MGHYDAGNRLMIWPIEPEAPDRCFKCNAPAEGERIQVKLAWSPVAGPHGRVSGAVFLATTRRAEIRLPICSRHRARRRRIVQAVIAATLIGAALLPLTLVLGGRIGLSENASAGFMMAGAILLLLQS